MPTIRFVNLLALTAEERDDIRDGLAVAALAGAGDPPLLWPVPRRATVGPLDTLGAFQLWRDYSPDHERPDARAIPAGSLVLLADGTRLEIAEDIRCLVRPGGGDRP